MKLSKGNKKVWDKIYRKGKILEYPNENLVRFVSYLFKTPKNKKLLDLGFGSGNNLIHLLKKRFKCYGCEISPAAVELTKKRLKTIGLSADLKLLNDKIPYPNDFFDIVVSWQVLYYNSQKSFYFMLKEVGRVLKHRGQFIVTLVRKDDIIVNYSDKIGKNIYKVNKKLPSQKGAIIYVVQNKKDIEKLFSNFGDLKIGHFETEFAGVKSAHWVIYGEKI